MSNELDDVSFVKVRVSLASRRGSRMKCNLPGLHGSPTGLGEEDFFAEVTHNPSNTSNVHTGLSNGMTVSPPEDIWQWLEIFWGGIT